MFPTTCTITKNIREFYSITSWTDLNTHFRRIPSRASHEMNSNAVRPVNEIPSNRARNILSMTIVSTFMGKSLPQMCVQHSPHMCTISDCEEEAQKRSEFLAVFHIRAADWVRILFGSWRRINDFYLLFFSALFSLNVCKAPSMSDSCLSCLLACLLMPHFSFSMARMNKSWSLTWASNEIVVQMSFGSSCVEKFSGIRQKTCWRPSF